MNYHFSNLADFLKSYGFLPLMSTKESLNPGSFQPSLCLPWISSIKLGLEKISWQHRLRPLKCHCHLVIFPNLLGHPSPICVFYPNTSWLTLRDHYPSSFPETEALGKNPSTFCIGIQFHFLLSISMTEVILWTLSLGIFTVSSSLSH